MKALLKTTLIILLFTAAFIPLKAQEGINLVPNPSFEEYSQCPDPATLDPMPNDMMELAIGWSNPTGYTPDYFNACVNLPNSFGVPANGYGSQNARTGNGYAGFITMYGETESREYIQTELTTSLITGKKYLVTFYVCLAKICTYAANNIGVYFSNTPISVTHSLVLPFVPQVSNDPYTNPLTDMNEWIGVSGVFTAQGGEKHMVIGNFNSYTTTDTTNTPALLAPPWEASYHYIDDVSVVCLDCIIGISETKIGSEISIFPNPTSEYLNIKFEEIYPKRITIFNSIGQMVFGRNEVSENLQINVEHYQGGIYFLKIETKEDIIIKRFLITK